MIPLRTATLLAFVWADAQSLYNRLPRSTRSLDNNSYLPVDKVLQSWDPSQGGKAGVFGKVKDGLRTETKFLENSEYRKQKNKDFESPCSSIVDALPNGLFEELPVTKDQFVMKMREHSENTEYALQLTWRTLIVDAESSRISQSPIMVPNVFHLLQSCLDLNDPSMVYTMQEFGVTEQHLNTLLMFYQSAHLAKEPNLKLKVIEMPHVSERNARSRSGLLIEDLTLFYMKARAPPKYFALAHRSKMEYLITAIGSGEKIFIVAESGVGKSHMMYQMAELLANPGFMTDMGFGVTDANKNHRLYRINEWPEVLPNEMSPTYGALNEVLYALRASGGSLWIDFKNIKNFVKNMPSFFPKLENITVYVTVLPEELTEFKSTNKSSFKEIHLVNPDQPVLNDICEMWRYRREDSSCVSFPKGFCKRVAQLADSYNNSPNPAYMFNILETAFSRRTFPEGLNTEHFFKVCTHSQLKERIRNIDNLEKLLVTPTLKDSEKSHLRDTLRFDLALVGASEDPGKLTRFIQERSQAVVRLHHFEAAQGTLLAAAKSDYKIIETAMLFDMKLLHKTMAQITEFKEEVFDRSGGDITEGLLEKLQERVRGQDHALRDLEEFLSMSMTDSSNKRVTLGIFFMYGPTGTGKTETAKALADALGMQLTIFPMNEYQGDTSIATFLGMNPGYVGYTKYGKLANAVVDHPSSVLLFDEFDKTSATLRKAMLSIMTEGEVNSKDPDVKQPVKLKNCILIFVSNYYGKEIAEVGLLPADKQESAYSSLERNLKTKLTKFEGWNPEFFNRFERMVRYSAFSKEDVPNILPLVYRSAFTLYPRWSLYVHHSFTHFLIQYFFNPLDGVRGLKNVTTTMMATRFSTVQRWLTVNLPETEEDETHEIELFICHDLVEKHEVYIKARREWCGSLQDEEKEERYKHLINATAMEQVFIDTARWAYRDQVYAIKNYRESREVRVVGEFKKNGYINRACKPRPKKKPQDAEIHLDGAKAVEALQQAKEQQNDYDKPFNYDKTIKIAYEQKPIDFKGSWYSLRNREAARVVEGAA